MTSTTHGSSLNSGFSSLRETLERLIASANGVIGICVRDLATGEEIGVREDEMFPLASVSKIPILVAAYRLVDAGTLDLTERLELTDARRCFGSGLLNFFDSGLQPTLRDLLHLMIVVSDNAATDMILERIGGAAAVTATMHDLCLTAIQVDRTICELLTDYFTALEPGLADMHYGEWPLYEAAIPGLKARGEDVGAIRVAVNTATEGRDLASPRDMARLCGQIAREECASPASCKAMLEILGRQQLNGRLPRHLPAFWKFPHKTGSLGAGAVVNDSGILYRAGEPVAAISAFCRDMHDPTYETETRLANVGRAVWDFYD